MLLLLQPAASQQKQLDALLKSQITPGSAGFHQWVTPEEFAQRFALSASQVSQVEAWLAAQGFAVAPLPASRGWIEFSGTAGQVERAFATSVVGSGKDDQGRIRYRTAGEIKLPQAIAGLVAGMVSLDGSEATTATIPATALPESIGVAELAVQSSIAKAQAVTPSLLADWLHLSPVIANGMNGSGESIAIPSRSNVRVEDFAAFRSSFGLPESALSVRLAGDDPGRTSDEAAAIAAASWAGATAPGAQIVLVPAASTNATDGIDLALAEAIDSDVAHTISLGYSNCEANLSTAHQAFYESLYRQAAAEGISVLVATGNSGAAACHQPTNADTVSEGWGVNGLASTPWNTAVGAVALSADAGSISGWQPSGSAQADYATGGGASLRYATPLWQSAVGVPASDPGLGTVAGTDHHRYLPDVSLPTVVAGQPSRSLAYCFSGESATPDCRLVTGGGSALSTAIFSGIAAILAQKYGPQGNLAPNLYALSRSPGSVSSPGATFVDVESGAAKLPCVAGSPDCTASPQGAGEIGFSAGPGYDLASGIGSINAQGLVANWATPGAVGTSPVTVEMTTVGGITYNPSAIIALSARVLSGSGGAVPTGTVQFYDETVLANTGSPVKLDAQGDATYSENGQFTEGGHNIAAIYSGDSTYESGESQPVTINIQPSPTALTVSPSTVNPVGGSTFTVTGTVTSTNPGNSPPSGSLTINLDGLPQGTTTLSTTGTVTSGSVTVTAPTAGSHTVQGYYSGDVNYNNATSPSVTITVSKVATVTSLSAVPATLTTGVPETFTAVIAPLTAVTGVTYNITGTVSFYDGGTTLLGTAILSGNTAILAAVTLTPSVVHTITAVYSGDTTYGPSTSAPLILEPILLPVTVVLTTSNSILAPGQAANLTATVTPVNTPGSTVEQHPTGTIYFYAGTTALGSASLVASVGDSSTAALSVPVLPAGVYVITAVYSGDLTYGPATSNSLDLQVEDFTISCSPSSTSVPQGESVSIPCIVASLGGLTGPIQLACAEQNPPQIGAMGCSFLPTVVTGNGTATLTVTTTGGNISTGSLVPPRDYRRGPPWPLAGGGIAVAIAGLFLLPAGRRGRRNLLALALLLVGLGTVGMGCNNGVTQTNSGTPLGVHTIKITAAADLTPPTVTVSHYAYVTINVTVPGA